MSTHTDQHTRRTHVQTHVGAHVYSKRPLPCLYDAHAGQFMMAFLTAVMTTIIQNRDRAGRDYEEKVDRIEEYMKFQAA